VLRLSAEQDSELVDRVEIGRLQFGEQAPARFANLVNAIRGGIVRPWMVVAGAP
jgi:hypothetical protein